MIHFIRNDIDFFGAISFCANCILQNICHDGFGKVPGSASFLNKQASFTRRKYSRLSHERHTIVNVQLI